MNDDSPPPNEFKYINTKIDIAKNTMVVAYFPVATTVFLNLRFGNKCSLLFNKTFSKISAATKTIEHTNNQFIFEIDESEKTEYALGVHIFTVCQIKRAASLILLDLKKIQLILTRIKVPTMDKIFNNALRLLSF